MRVFRRSRDSKLQPVWHFDTKGVVWRLFPSAEGFLIGEERDLDRKISRFFSLDPLSGKLLWLRDSFGDPWWIGLLGLAEGVLLLHGFASPDMPLPRGIIAVDAVTGAALWQRDDLEYADLAPGVVHARRAERTGSAPVTIDLRRGTDVSLPEFRPAAVAGNAPAHLTLLFPDPVHPEDPEFLRLQRCWPEAARAVRVEHAEYGPYAVFAAHEFGTAGPGEPPRVTTTVCVIDVTMTMLFTQKTARDIHGAVPDAFFLLNNMLYLLVDRRRVMAVRLGPATA